MSYVVLVLDNWHFMDPDEEYELPAFDDADAALAACRRIIDTDLVHMHEPGLSAAALYEKYSLGGETPLLQTVGSPTVYFSARDYARLRCEEICAGARTGAQGAYADTAPRAADAVVH